MVGTLFLNISLYLVGELLRHDRSLELDPKRNMKKVYSI